MAECKRSGYCCQSVPCPYGWGTHKDWYLSQVLGRPFIQTNRTRMKPTIKLILNKDSVINGAVITTSIIKSKVKSRTSKFDGIKLMDFMDALTENGQHKDYDVFVEREGA